MPCLWKQGVVITWAVLILPLAITQHLPPPLGGRGLRASKGNGEAAAAAAAAAGVVLEELALPVMGVQLEEEKEDGVVAWHPSLLGEKLLTVGQSLSIVQDTYTTTRDKETKLYPLTALLLLLDQLRIACPIIRGIIGNGKSRLTAYL